MIGDYFNNADLTTRRIAQAVDQSALINCSTATGSVNALVLDLTLATGALPPVRLLDGITLSFIPNLTNTSTTVTLTISTAVGAKNIKKSNGTSALSVGDIVLGIPTLVQWDAINGVFRLLLSANGGVLITDADKGDITVSSLGSVFTIDNDVVTYAKMQNVSATDKLLGRSTAGAGDVEEIALTSAGRALIDDADAAAQRTTLGLDFLANFTPASKSFLFDEFVTGGFTSGQIGSLSWLSNVSGVAAGIAANTVANTNHPGMVMLGTGTDTTGRAAIYLDGSNITFSGGAIVYEAVIYQGTAADGTNSYTMRLGFGTSVSGDHTDGAYFEYSNANANWLCKTAKASTRTTTTTSTAFVAGFTKLRIEVNAAATSVEFFVAGVSVATITTNIPNTSSIFMGIIQSIIKSAGTSNRNLVMDYVLYQNTFTTTR